MIGYTKEEYEAHVLMDIVHPDDQEQLASMEGVLHREGAMASDFRVRHKEGHYLHMSSKNVLIPGEQGKDDMILTIIRDVTGIKQAMKELEEAKVRAEESDKLKSAFLANVSHEIRTPMNSIIGFSNLLKDEGTEDHMRELYVSRIISNSELLLALITDIIDLAKIESGQLPLVYGRVRISKLIQDMEQYAHDEISRLQKGDLEIVTVLDLKDCELETDVTRITQVLKNLINNAIKFTEDGKVEIGCRKGESDESLCFYVEDTGIGISEEHFEVIFDQFRQLDGSNTRKFSGTGLGLTICKNLVHLLGGRIWVESGPGRGACFLVEHPLKAPTAGRQVVEEVRESGESREAHEKISILAVDDEPDTLELYQVLLTQMGHHVTTARTGYEALRILEQFPLPDLVLMDILMPVMSGTDTLKIIRERYPEVKVLAQSAQALIGDRERFLEEGYDGYLPKPFTAEQLEQLISELVDQ
jgi:PAS domain S-box-containing protein